jgi:hypothetical protein
MQQHELNGKTILLVELPVGYEFDKYWLVPNNLPGKEHQQILSAWCPNDGMGYSIDGRIPEGNWGFVATTDTITEDQAIELWGSVPIMFRRIPLELAGRVPQTARAHLRSWLTANGITGNHAILQKVN